MMKKTTKKTSAKANATKSAGQSRRSASYVKVAANAAQISREAIEDLVSEPPRKQTVRAVVKELLPDIRAAMRRGYTLEQIAERLKKRAGINPLTLRGYIYGRNSVVDETELEADDPLIAFRQKRLKQKSA
jgi:hypothetical protein